MTKVLLLSWVTLREALRQKLAVNLLVFALLLIAASITLSELTYGEQHRIISDLALTSAQLFGTLIAVFLGAGLVAGDVQRRTIYPIVAKPVGRWQYLLGRYAGLVLTLWLNLLVMALASGGVLALYTGGLAFLSKTPLVAAFVGIAAQLAIVAAIATVFSSMTNATLAAIFTLALALAGHFSRDVFVFYKERQLVRWVAYVIPNLGALDFKVQVVYQTAIPAARVAWPLAYAALYVACALALASASFARRDFR
ncbi:ABC transporter permease [Anaeromyxobacter soli]|uniref:ABC transporter permease n=1 Tax=Anaeromyxobacter soli TaxID=2922725 RepID=UPI001FAFDBC8|nr:ABC transporter permease subunit [Anaeromyxobacter sp. SG29]